MSFNLTNEPTFDSYHSPVLSLGGMVASSQPLASTAGLQILNAGGNSADAAVAMAAVLNVTEPTSTGIGGDCFALYYKASTGQITALNGSGRSPKNLSLELLADKGLSEKLPPFHALTVTVPGACAGWFDLIERHGSMAMPDILKPAIELAERGFPVAPITAHFWKNGVSRQLSQSSGGSELMIDGRAPHPGEIFRNPSLSRTLRIVAEKGMQGFYQGEIAEAIVATISAHDGVMTLEDLAAHTSTWDEPISTTYRNVRVWECPPNGQGLAALLALNILEEFDLSALPPLSPQRLHLQIEAMRLAFADTRWYVTDPSTSNHQPPLSALLSKAYATQRRKLIDHEKATVNWSHGSPVSGSDTVYLCVVDNQGNACSFINSNYMGFGTGLVPEGWGFSLQNRGYNFSLDAHHPNALAPAKRPYHTIIPAMLTRETDDTLFGPFGVMGGFMQPQGHMQVVVNMIDDGLDPQTTLNQPRFCIEDGKSSGRIALETGLTVETMSNLARMGHQIYPVHGFARSIFGRGQAIVRDKHGVLWGGSDPRADGYAAGQLT